MSTQGKDDRDRYREWFDSLTEGQKLMVEHGIHVPGDPTAAHPHRSDEPNAPMPRLVSVRYHRNGVGGEGYYVVVFDDNVDGDRRALCAVVPSTIGGCEVGDSDASMSGRSTLVLVIDLEDPLNTLRGADTWGRWVVARVDEAIADGSAYQA